MIQSASSPIDEGLIGYTVYRRTRDFPQVAFVVRPWRVYRQHATPIWPYVHPMFDPHGAVPDTYQHAIVCLCDSLAEARVPFIRYGLVHMEREPGDDSVIVEVWI